MSAESDLDQVHTDGPDGCPACARMIHGPDCWSGHPDDSATGNGAVAVLAALLGLVAALGGVLVTLYLIAW